MSKEKIFCGGGNEKFEGNLIEIQVALDRLPEEFITTYKGKRYIRLKVVKMREPKERQTHYVEVDQYVQQQKETTPVPQELPIKKEEPNLPEEDGLPF